jgi:hypothetical protein
MVFILEKSSEYGVSIFGSCSEFCFAEEYDEQGYSERTRFMNVLQIEFGLVCGLGYRSGDAGMGAERGKLSAMTRAQSIMLKMVFVQSVCYLGRLETLASVAPNFTPNARTNFIIFLFAHEEHNSNAL